jgi:hypothetical protein
MDSELGSASRRAVIDTFDSFREELDEHNDRRDRLIKVRAKQLWMAWHPTYPSKKASRDVTNLSKKTIFLLHRLVSDSSLDEHAAALRAVQQGSQKLLEVRKLFAGLRHELVGDRFWRYERAVSPGLQEYIEALGFMHYLEHGTLITYDQAQSTLYDADGILVRMRVVLRACASSRSLLGIVFSFTNIGLFTWLVGFEW